MSLSATARTGFALTLLWACLGDVRAQTSAEDVQVDFGFAGEIVADAWNPLRVTLRGVQDAELSLELDVGSLRRGPVRLSYRAPLPGGPGLTTFEDDLYLPTWVSFAWTLTTPAGVLAEGEVPRYAADPEPLQLALTREPGGGRLFFSPAARVVEVTPSDLPERAAAYDGVAGLSVLPGTAPPEPAALVAAAGAGAEVLLSAGLGPSFAEVSALAGTGTRVVGAGALVRLAEERRAGLGAGIGAAGRLEPDLLTATLTDDALTRAPTGQDGGWLALRLALYAAVVALLLRFGGPPGVLAALLLAGTLTLAAWRTRPAEPLLVRSRSLALGAGGLALRTDVTHLFSFPAGAAGVPHPARPLATVPRDKSPSGDPEPLTPLTATEPESVGTTDYRVGPERFETDLGAYGSLLLLGKPRLEPAVLGWSDGVLVNGGTEPLTDVFVTWGGGEMPPGAVGSPSRGGRQADLAPEGTLTVASGNLMPQGLYEELTPLLPPGSAVARGGGTVYVALPENPADPP